MNRFTSLLLPLDGSPEAAKGVGCALWLSKMLNATLHVLHASPRSYDASKLPDKLHLPVPQPANVVLHQTAAQPEAALIAAIADYDVGLVIMTARGESAATGRKPSQALGSIARMVLERTPVPVLLLPSHFHEVLPWKSILVAASGEVAADLALEAATRLAGALKLIVTVVHVGNGPTVPGGPPLGGYSDSAHHEYSHRMENMVERGLSACTHGERCCVHRILLRTGDPADVLLREVRAHASDVLALGYHGTFVEGHAFVLKQLLEKVNCPLLLLRGSEHPKTQLRVGEEFDR